MQRSAIEYDLARAYADEREPGAAFAHLEEAIRLDSSNFRAHFLLGSLHLLRGDLERAQPSLDRALRLIVEDGSVEAAPLLPEVRNTMGNLLIRRGQYEQALAILQLAIDDPAYTHPYQGWFNIAWAHSELQRYDEAEDALERAVANAPSFCAAWARLGLVRWFQAGRASDEAARRDRWEKAEEAFTHGLEVEADECQMQDAYRYRAEARVALGRNEDAVADFERCVELGRETESGLSCSRALAGAAEQEASP